MTFSRKSLEDMLQEIEHTGETLSETISPVTDEDKFMKDNKGHLQISVNYLSDLISIYDEKSSIFDNEYFAVALAFENALIHGNENDPSKQLTVQVYKGERGNVLQITDSGEGFDYQMKIDDLGSSDTISFRGNGLKALRDTKYEVSYSEKGKTVYLLNRT